MEKQEQTDAGFFGESVKRNHRTPLLQDDIAWNFYKATDVLLSRRFGAWKITQVMFEDGTKYNVGEKS